MQRITTIDSEQLAHLNVNSAPLASPNHGDATATVHDTDWTAQRLNALSVSLDQLPPPERSLGVTEAIVVLLPTLRRMRARGHSLEAVAQHLRANGLTIAMRTLSRHLAAKKPKPGRNHGD